jgi:uncharacterized protein (TIGR03067 family)
LVAQLHDIETVSDTLARKDRVALQGAWEFVAGPRPARLLIAGEHYTIHFANGDVYTGTFRLDAGHHPRTIDMNIVDGPERHKGKTALGIYLLEGQRLMFCPGRPGSAERPPFFPPVDDAGCLCLIFQREKRA